MNLPSDNDPLHAAINAKLVEVVDGSKTVPAWRDAWLRLGPDTTEEERLAVYQAIRRAGSLPPEAGFYLVAWQADAIASLRAETELRELDDQLEEIEETHGRDEEGDSPVEYDELMQRYYEEWDDMFVATLNEVGEQEMSQLFETNRSRFEELNRAGQEFFHGPAGPAWLDDLIEAVAECMEADSPMGPLGLRYLEDDGLWEILVYPTPVELLGGAMDGTVVDPGYSLDLIAVQAIFDRVDDVTWNAHGHHGAEAPFVSVEGMFEGKEVFLRVLSAAPDDEAPGLKFKVNG